MIGPPKPYPCASCPYRRDVPSGVWSREEYLKLPNYDRETGDQPPGAFMCHQDDQRLCSGWAGCHDGTNLLGLRLAVAFGQMTVEVQQEAIEYESPVPLFGTGMEACVHGLREVLNPSEDAQAVVEKIEGRRARRGAS